METPPVRNREIEADSVTTPPTGPGTRDSNQPVIESTTPVHMMLPCHTTHAGTSTLIRAWTMNNPIRLTMDLQNFLQWQANWCYEPEEQKCFLEDAQGYPHLLVFAAMRKKSLYIHLIHSTGIYPNIPGVDTAKLQHGDGRKTPSALTSLR